MIQSVHIRQMVPMGPWVPKTEKSPSGPAPINTRDTSHALLRFAHIYISEREIPTFQHINFAPTQDGCE